MEPHLLAGVGKPWDARWSGEGQVVGEDGTGVNTTFQAAVAAIIVGLSMSPGHSVPQFPLS